MWARLLPLRSPTRPARPIPQSCTAALNERAGEPRRSSEADMTAGLADVRSQVEATLPQALEQLQSDGAGLAVVSDAPRASPKRGGASISRRTSTLSCSAAGLAR